MAVELLPERAALSLENYVVSRGTIADYSNQEDLYPASDLTLFDRHPCVPASNASSSAQ